MVDKYEVASEGRFSKDNISDRAQKNFKIGRSEFTIGSRIGILNIVYPSKNGTRKQIMAKYVLEKFVCAILKANLMKVGLDRL